MNIGFVWDDRTIEANVSLISVDRAVNRTNHTVKTNSKSDNVSTEEKPKDCYSFEEKILTILHDQIKKHFIRFTKELDNVILNNSGSIKYDGSSLPTIGFSGVYQNPEAAEV